jgi:flagellar basal body rod protein FlgC
MAFLDSLNISGSGLTAQKLRMQIVAQNLANAQTTRTETVSRTGGNWWCLQKETIRAPSPPR